MKYSQAQEVIFAANESKMSQTLAGLSTAY